MNEPLREGIDYYVENGLYVFTAEFLRRRGYCCRSGCRHCPYGFTQLAAAESAGERTVDHLPVSDDPERG